MSAQDLVNISAAGQGSRALQRAMNSTVYQLDPLQDPRWAALVETHRHASVFHTAGWLGALRRTYGYRPIAFTTSLPTGELKNALLFAWVRSWLTGQRIVSLPFSDHCEPLFDSSDELDIVLDYVWAKVNHRCWKYVEIRPIDGKWAGQAAQHGFGPAYLYSLHRVDLRPALNDVFLSLDKDSVQRRIRRAERAGLIEKCGRSEELLRAFYDLLILTRKRHHLPPQPFVWFNNVIDCLGDAAQIRMACSKEGTPVAAILTLRFKDTVVYKYGASDEKFKNLGATPLLLWRAIEDAKAKGANEFDLGRSEEDNAGLITFKNKWAKDPTRLVYWRYPPLSNRASKEHWGMRAAKPIFACLPNTVLEATGRYFYRHMG